MRLSDFLLLTEDQKKWTVLHQGVLIGKRSSANCSVFLFQVNHFYAEMFCNRHNKAVEEYRVFAGTAALHPYLESIPLDDLFR
ncbi:hypothetical protein [Flavisolibacter nicotianae]|uniref:hypothetical protein n=1 Tax=Flavisolibacter nicotianae TaxID=2364882 RepID=UPI000EAF1C31|nr:hypothetical protein [Flavisolibacter nicotianae]